MGNCIISRTSTSINIKGVTDLNDAHGSIIANYGYNASNLPSGFSIAGGVVIASGTKDGGSNQIAIDGNGDHGIATRYYNGSTGSQGQSTNNFFKGTDISSLCTFHPSLSYVRSSVLGRPYEYHLLITIYNNEAFTSGMGIVVLPDTYIAPFTVFLPAIKTQANNAPINSNSYIANFADNSQAIALYTDRVNDGYYISISATLPTNISRIN